MAFTQKCKMGGRLIPLLSRYDINSPASICRGTEDQDMPWIFQPEEKEPSPIKYRSIMVSRNSWSSWYVLGAELTSLTSRSNQYHCTSCQTNRKHIRTGKRRQRDISENERRNDVSMWLDSSEQYKRMNRKTGTIKIGKKINNFWLNLNWVAQNVAIPGQIRRKVLGKLSMSPAKECILAQLFFRRKSRSFYYLQMRPQGSERQSPSSGLCWNQWQHWKPYCTDPGRHRKREEKGLSGVEEKNVRVDRWET